MLRVGLCLGLAWASAARAEEPAGDDLDTALELRSREEYPAALRLAESLRARHPDDPEPALFETATLYWRLLYDETDPALDASIEASARRALELGRERLALDPEDARAHFQCGQAYADLVRLYGLRDRYLRGALIAERGQHHLERALELDPDLLDAKYMLGLGLYYVAALPGLIQKLDWLWFIPEGDRDRGVAYLEEVAAAEGPYQLSAMYLLSEIYTLEQGAGSSRAIELLEALRRMQPEHTLFLFRLMELRLLRGEYDDVAQAGRAIEAAPARSDEARGRQAMARIWHARAALRMGRTEEAFSALDDATAEQSLLPRFGAAWLLLIRAEAEDARGNADRALALYREVLALAPEKRRRDTTWHARVGVARLEHRASLSKR